MTSHKSKGLQNPNVWVEKPEQLDEGWNVSRPWMRGSQRRIKYVTVTRSQENLFFIDEGEKRRK